MIHENFCNDLIPSELIHVLFICQGLMKIKTIMLLIHYDFFNNIILD